MAHRFPAVSTAVVTAILVASCGTSTTSSSSTAGVSASASPSASAPPTATPVPTPVPTADPTAGWVSYHSAANHLTFKHPAALKPLECEWVLIQPGVSPNTCPHGDGFCCVFLAASDNGQTGGFSLISDHPALYSNVLRTAVTVNGVKGTRTSGTQTEGQGSGSPQIAHQVEYDFTTGGRTYNFLANVGPADSGVATDAIAPPLFDQLVQTVTFG